MKNTLKYLLLAGSFFCATAQAENWLYRNPAAMKKFVYLDSTRSVLGVGDIGHDVEFCDKKSSFECFRSSGIEFYVHRNFDGSEKTWHSDSQKYEASDVRTLSILGSTFQATTIVTESAIGKMYFIYSPVRGLIAFGSISQDGEQAGVFLLESGCGFAASASCKELVGSGDGAGAGAGAPSSGR